MPERGPTTTEPQTENEESDRAMEPLCFKTLESIVNRCKYKLEFYQLTYLLGTRSDRKMSVFYTGYKMVGVKPRYKKVRAFFDLFCGLPERRPKPSQTCIKRGRGVKGHLYPL